MKLLITLVLGLALAACSGSETPADAQTAAPAATTAPPEILNQIGATQALNKARSVESTLKAADKKRRAELEKATGG